MKPLKAKIYNKLFGFPSYTGQGNSFPLGKRFYDFVGYPRRIEEEEPIDCHHSGKIGVLGFCYYSLFHGFIKLVYKIHTPSFEFRHRFFGVSDAAISGVDSSDYPDFCDAYYESASWNDTLEDLTDDELEKLQGFEDINQDAHESLI